MDKTQELVQLLQKNGSLGVDNYQRAKNEKFLKENLYKGETYVALRENLKRRFGLDIQDANQFPVESLNWKALKQKLDLREADSESTFSQFLRAGIQNITMSMYETVKTSYEDWVTTVNSSKFAELYAPNQGPAFPRQVGPQEKYPEVGAAALDIQLRNYKFGSLYPVEWELLEDDQTGSFARQASMLGEYLRVLTEVWCYGKLASVANMQYIQLSIPTSETKPSSEATYPWSTGLVGGGATRPGVYGALNQGNLQAAFIALMNQKNLQGIKMQVTPDRILIGPTKIFDLAVLLNSAYYPSGAAAAGNVGGAFAINPIKGIADTTVSRFIAKNDGTFNGDSTAWYLVDSKKPWFVLQLREAVSVTQENPQAGESFNRDVYRFKVRSRLNADFLDPRFAYQGSDGSA